MQLDTLQDVLMEQLADLQSAEIQLIAALPKMAAAAHAADLRKAFEDHLEETREHAARLEEALREIPAPVEPQVCKAMQGLIKEGEEIIEAHGEPAALDAALIAAAQRVEHYEIAGYGTARALAGELGFSRAASLLGETLDEEAKANSLLTKIAEGGFLSSGVNQAAASH